MNSVVFRFRRLACSLALLLVGGGASALQASPPTNWITASPAALSSYVSQLVSFDDELLLAQTSFGFRSSFDGELWTPADGGLVTGGYFILKANDTFQALPASGSMAHISTNGVTWRTQALTGTRPWGGVAYGGGRFVAAGTGTLDISSDGVTWTPQAAPHRHPCGGIAYVQDHFVLLSETEGVWLSPDGLTWQPHALAPQPPTTPPADFVYWSGLNCLNGRCFAFGSKNETPDTMVAVSDNGGADWDVLPFDSKTFVRGMAYGRGRYVLVGSGVVGYSDDGRHWTFDQSTLTNPNPTGVAFVSGRFVMTDSERNVYFSDDGIRWRQHSLPRVSLNAVTATPTGFVAVGNHGTILTSADGFDWQAEASGTQVHLYGVANAGGLTIATGASGTILTSPDDHAWTRCFHASPDTTPLHGVVYARGRYVVAGAYLSSTDGTNWEVTPGYATSLANTMQAVIDDGTQFLAFGPAPSPEIGNVIGRSPDGLTWTYANTGLNRPDYGRSLAYGEGLYVALGTSFLSSSPNAADWRLLPRFDQLQAVIHTVDGFVAVGSPQVTTENGLVLHSPDGANWTPITLDYTGPLNGVAYRDGLYVAVTANGQILCSTPTGGARLGQHRWVPGRGFQFGLGGVPNQQYRVQYTTDLQTWNDLRTVTVPSSSEISPILDPDAASSSARAYRVVTP